MRRSETWVMASALRAMVWPIAVAVSAREMGCLADQRSSADRSDSPLALRG